MKIKRLLFALIVISLFSGCVKTNARVEVNELMVTVENLDKSAWTDCRFIINAAAGADHQYVYAAGDIPGLQSKTVMLPQFTNKDGKRFIPILTKVSDVKIQCATPPVPFSKTLTE